jgi:hypothetical protein
MKGYPIEQLSMSESGKLIRWLETTYGKSNKDTWFVEQDYDLETLVLAEDIATLYELKWK